MPFGSDVMSEIKGSNKQLVLNPLLQKYMIVRFYILNIMHSSVFEKDENEMWTMPTEAEHNVLICSQLMSC